MFYHSVPRSLSNIPLPFQLTLSTIHVALYAEGNAGASDNGMSSGVSVADVKGVEKDGKGWAV